jgi:hypothetical protein
LVVDRSLDEEIASGPLKRPQLVKAERRFIRIREVTPKMERERSRVGVPDDERLIVSQLGQSGQGIIAGVGWGRTLSTYENLCLCYKKSIRNGT